MCQTTYTPPAAETLLVPGKWPKGTLKGPMVNGIASSIHKLVWHIFLRLASLRAGAVEAGRRGNLRAGPIPRLRGRKKFRSFLGNLFNERRALQEGERAAGNKGRE